MAKRKKNLAISSVFEDTIFFYTDEGLVADVLAIEGVTSVSSDENTKAGLRIAFVDGRYDSKEVAKEMEELNKNTDIPDEFK